MLCCTPFSSVPEFVEVEGCIVLRDLSVQVEPEIIRKKRETSTKVLKAYVDSFNWIEVPYLVSDQSASDNEIDALAEVIHSGMACRASRSVSQQKLYRSRAESGRDRGEAGVGFEELWGE